LPPRMILSTLFLQLFLVVAGFVAATPVKRDFGPVDIFVPPSTYSAPRTMYGRHVMLPDVSA